MIYFLSYEHLNKYGKQILKDKKLEHKIYYLPLITASISEFNALIFLVPFDIIQTRL